MTNLDQAANNAIKFAEKTAKNNFQFMNRMPKVWKGRKFISKDKWTRKICLPVQNDYLEYMPDIFIDSRIFVDLPKDEQTRMERSKWLDDYYSFFKKRRDPKYGHAQCRGCSLGDTSDLFGLKIIFLEYIWKYLPKYDYPCTVSNMFQCPYGYGKYSDWLLENGVLYDMVKESVMYAWDLTAKYDQNIYIDFLKDMAGTENTVYSMNEPIWHVMLSRITPWIAIRSISDIYNSITCDDLLKLLMDQYADAVDTGNYRSVVGGMSRFDVKSIQAFMSDICNGAEKIPVKIENLRDYEGNDLKKEEMKKQKSVQRLEQLELESLEDAKRIKEKSTPGVCLACNELARIRCMNCQKWICLDHWEEHGYVQHNFTMKIPDYHFDSLTLNH